MKAIQTVKARPFSRNGAFIRHAREAIDPRPSQETFAAMIGTTRRHMIRLENGEHLPSRDLRDRIADKAGVDRSLIQADGDDEEADSLAPLSRDEAELFASLMARVAQTLVSAA